MKTFVKTAISAAVLMVGTTGAFAKGHDQSEGQGDTVDQTVAAAQGLGDAIGTQYGFSLATPSAEKRQDGTGAQ
jgi:hypothetical protein